MEVRAERAGPAVVVHLEGGRLVVEEDTRRLHELVRAVTRLDHGCSVVMDLGKVRQIDCSGIGQLVELANQVGARGGLFSLVNVAPREKHLLALLGLLRVLPAFASREEAITACWSAAARGCAPPRPRGEMPILAAHLPGERGLRLAPAF
jgi:anti-anti-sigma factor